MNYFLLLLVLFVSFCDYILSQNPPTTTDYCKPSLCPEKNHIGCKNDGSFGKSCSNDSSIIDVFPFRHLILNRHNKIRNRVAAGNLTDYKPAARMATMVWDPELADLALLNVKTCQFEHDVCRNTDRFKHVGQNMAWKWAWPNLDPRETIIWAINEWFSEHKDGAMEFIDNHYFAVSPISHFTLMIVEENRRVGCAMLWQTDSLGDGAEAFVTCNYATTNMRKLPIYESGPAGSKCITGTNPNHPALCSLTEPIVINRW